jgi:hypothetical protein
MNTNQILLVQMPDSSISSKPLNLYPRGSNFTINYETPKKEKCQFNKEINDWLITELPDSFGLYVRKTLITLPYDTCFYMANVKVKVCKKNKLYYIEIETPEIIHQCELNQKIHIGYNYDENDIVVNNKYVSRKHLAIKIGADTFELIENPLEPAVNCTWIQQSSLVIKNNSLEHIKIGDSKFWRVSLMELHDINKDTKDTTTNVGYTSTNEFGQTSTIVIGKDELTLTIGEKTKLLNSIPQAQVSITQEVYEEWSCKYGVPTPKWSS